MRPGNVYMCRSRPEVYVCTLQKTRGVYALAVVMAGHVTPCFDSIQLVDAEHSRVSPGLRARRPLLMCTHLSTLAVCPLTSPSRCILGLMVIQSRYCHKDGRVYAQRRGPGLRWRSSSNKHRALLTGSSTAGLHSGALVRSLTLAYR